MDLFLRLILIFLAYYLYMSYYKSMKIKSEKLEEMNGEFIFTYLSYVMKKEMYFDIHEVENVGFSKMIIKNKEFTRLTLVITLENHDIIRIFNKRNAIIFFKSCKENSPVLYEEIFARSDIFGGMPGFFGLSSLRDIVENEIKRLEEEER
ncbi:hypothetical protein [Sebaldella sp. S0638]|uniref:hypothetical protein n=1 Tax=Sebaldella sp. S0638 TaxID=2957809 RepID=UPI00209F073C|nr:hypothetical protein [Sebaldella sp. S0638]MCP1223812.1 hypothetical protein [Sebaldella sp. S0638]